jgi:alpha-1,6-mannosyltransferase
VPANRRGTLKSGEEARPTRARFARIPNPVKLTPSSRVYLLGAILFVALTICSRHWADRGGPSFLVSLTVAGLAYLLAICEFFSTSRTAAGGGPGFPRRVVVIGLILAALWHLLFLRMPSGPDDDIHRYLWDGRLQRLGYNPYLVVPSDPAVRALHTSDTRNMNNPDLPSPYPAGAQLFFRAVTAIHESTFALKVAFVICDLAIVFVLLDILRCTRQGAHLLLTYAWNPLLTIEVAGSGHIDILGALLLLVSAAALVRHWRTLAALAFGLAVAVKFLPIVLVPLYWKRVRARDAALAAAVVGLLYLPFLDHGRIPIGSLGAYVQGFRFNDLVFGTLERGVAKVLRLPTLMKTSVGPASSNLHRFWRVFKLVAPPLTAAGLALLAALLTATWLARRALPGNYAEGNTSPEWTPEVFVWPMAVALLCAPVVYPWYLLWLLPFLWSPATLPIIVWTVSVAPIYVVWHLRALGRPWVIPGWAPPLEYGSVAVAGAIIAWSRLTRPHRPSLDAE